MEKVGSGFYYHVYKISNTRVRKLPTSHLRKAWLLLWWRMVPLSRLVSEMLDLDAWIRQEVVQSRIVVERFPSKNTIGNPSPIADDGTYEQDYAPRLKDILASISEERFTEYVRTYCSYQHQLWAVGHADCIWNFTLNCGVRPDTGELILIDLNELSYNKERMEKDIYTKEWEHSNSFLTLEKHYPRLYAIACKETEMRCTISELEKYWKTIPNSSELR